MDVGVLVTYSLAMCRLLLLLLAITFPWAAGAGPEDGCAPVNCERPVSLVEKAICQHAELKQADRAIAHDCETLAKVYAGETLTVFIAGQQAWFSQRNACNSTPTAARHENGLSGCLTSRVEERVALLQRLIGDPASIESTVASYAFVRPWYVKKFARQFEGKRVNILGMVVLTACSKGRGKSLAGRLIDKAAEIEIRFKSLSTEDVSFMCEKQPHSWWLGTVKLDHDRPYLYSTEILGRELP
jgi:uncharacterized protein